MFGFIVVQMIKRSFTCTLLLFYDGWTRSLHLARICSSLSIKINMFFLGKKNYKYSWYVISVGREFWAHKTSLNQPWKWAVMYLCGKVSILPSFYVLDIWFWKCSGGVDIPCLAPEYHMIWCLCIDHKEDKLSNVQHVMNIEKVDYNLHPILIILIINKQSQKHTLFEH
jgi:hypothetical protein